MSPELSEIMQRVEALTPDEQLRLISYLTELLRGCEIKTKSRRKVTEFAGIAPNLLGDMDAQEYVTRLRSGEFPDLEIEAKEFREQA